MKNSLISGQVIELSAPWQLLYLPEYVARFRQIERKLCKVLERQAFQECMLPKMIGQDQFEELQKCMPRFVPEWSAESVTAHIGRRDIDYNATFHLCHWQCEPFYFFLRQEKPVGSIRLYDRSGWSYRAEQHLDVNRLLAFQRIEVVFLVPQQEVRETLDRLLKAIQRVLDSLGLSTRLVVRKEEMALTNEVLVKDIEVLDKDGEWIEAVGAHLHGRLMLDGLGAEVGSDFVTGCCGIGLSRIANLAARGGRIGSPEA